MGIKAGLFSSPKIYEGECYSLIDWEKEFAKFDGTTLFQDVQRFSDLSDGYLVQHPDYPNVIGDARYSMLPTTVSPLWGITIDTVNTDQHVSFDSYRDASEKTRFAFLDMLFGK